MGNITVRYWLVSEWRNPGWGSGGGGRVEDRVGGGGEEEGQYLTMYQWRVFVDVCLGGGGGGRGGVVGDGL